VELQLESWFGAGVEDFVATGTRPFVPREVAEFAIGASKINVEKKTRTKNREEKLPLKTIITPLGTSFVSERNETDF